MNKCKYFVILFYLIISFVKGQQVDAVQVKLKEDHLSLETFKYLSATYQKKQEKTYQLYIALYNIGIPLVRLFEYETLQSYFNKNSQNNLKEVYILLISDDKNYINDDRREEYFQKYLKDYFIMPPTG
ncbi:hypothetical protein KRX57_03015 [Weeksellaceae bacterium TAE3-ERU29]|nr:hypothetical protein [Weeksellaceae bacterium TAE3-ERU29]